MQLLLFIAACLSIPLPAATNYVDKALNDAKLALRKNVIEPYFYKTQKSRIYETLKDAVMAVEASAKIDYYLGDLPDNWENFDAKVKLIDFLNDRCMDELDAEKDYYHLFRSAPYESIAYRKNAWAAYKAASNARFLTYEKLIEDTDRVPLDTELVRTHAFTPNRIEAVMA